MNKVAGLLVLILLHCKCYALEMPDMQQNPLLDKVKFQISAKRWVNTKMSLLTVNINATLGNQELVKARSDIMNQLTKIAQGEWHLIQFDRSQDSSGLDKLTVQAQVRVDQASLNDVYKNAKVVSKPGTNYEIGSIEFKPGLSEIQEAKNVLRESLYVEVQNELARINKIYTNQTYSVSNIIFVDGDSPELPKAYQTRQMVTATMDAAAPVSSDIALGNELVMTAVVQIASNRNIDNSNKQPNTP